MAGIGRTEVREAFEGSDWPPVLSVEKFAELLELSPKTIYLWIAQGKLEGAIRKQGKRWLIWRDRAIPCLFG